MNNQQNRRQHRQRGLTLIEALVTSAGMVAILGGATALLSSSRGAWAVGNNRSSLQETGRRILNDVISELRGSGITQDAGEYYPKIFIREITTEAASERGDQVASMNPAQADDATDLIYSGDGGVQNRIVRNEDRPTNELVYQLPADLDGDERPIDANGDLEWGPELHSLRIFREADGIPWLWKISEVGGLEVSRERIGPHVANITFDVISNDLTLGFNECAVVVYLERQNDQGQMITTALESSVVLRNTEELWQ